MSSLGASCRIQRVSSRAAAPIQAAQMIIHAQGSEFNTKCAIVLNRLAWPTATNNSFAGLAAAADLLCGTQEGSAILDKYQSDWSSFIWINFPSLARTKHIASKRFSFRWPRNPGTKGAGCKEAVSGFQRTRQGQ